MSELLRIQVRYFASIREALGNAESLTMPPGSTVAELR